MEVEFQVNFSRGQLYSFHCAHSYALFKLSVIRCVSDLDQMVSYILFFRKALESYVFIIVAHFSFLEAFK